MAPRRHEEHEANPSSEAGPFQLGDLDYELPPELIAQEPAPQRDAARMMVVDRARIEIRDGWIRDIVDLLRARDVLVVNDTRVIPAKFFLRRPTGGLIEGLFLEEPSPGRWRVLLKGARRIKPGEVLRADEEGPQTIPEKTTSPEVGFRALSAGANGEWLLEVDSADSAEAILERIGQAPLPPYIRRVEQGGAARGAPQTKQLDGERYQTVYAKHAGAVAAPTAGLHFTDELLRAIAERGVQVVCVTLHVGLGTFKPIEAASIDEHRMHREWYRIPPETTAAIHAAKQRGGRVIAVGTTSVRTLESAAHESGGLPEAGCQGQTELFVFPPYRFRVVDALLTNFHLPRSTLLALVMAFAGTELTRRAYQHAIAERYRFYSYGDAMWIE